MHAYPMRRSRLQGLARTSSDLFQTREAEIRLKSGERQLSGFNYTASFLICGIFLGSYARICKQVKLIALVEWLCKVNAELQSRAELPVNLNFWYLPFGGRIIFGQCRAQSDWLDLISLLWNDPLFGLRNTS